MRADFGDPPLSRTISRSAFRSVETMRDSDRRAILRHPSQCLLDGLFRLDIKRSRRLVQNEDSRIVQNGPRDGDPLTLASRQIVPVLFQPRVVTVRQADDKIVRVGDFGRLNNLFRLRARLRVLNILRDRPAEQERLLQHDADLRAQIFLPDHPDIDIVDPNLPFVHIIKREIRLIVVDLPDPEWPTSPIISPVSR